MPDTIADTVDLEAPGTTGSDGWKRRRCSMFGRHDQSGLTAEEHEAVERLLASDALPGMRRYMAVNPSYVANLEPGRVNATVGQLAHVAEALGAGFEVAFPTWTPTESG